MRLEELVDERIGKNGVKMTGFVDFGTVLSNKDGIIEISGLPEVMVGEAVNIGPEHTGLILGLTANLRSAVVLGDDTAIVQGMVVTRTGNLRYVPVGEALLGRVVDILGNPVDGLEQIDTTNFGYIESKAPGIILHKTVHELMQTGILFLFAPFLALLSSLAVWVFSLFSEFNGIRTFIIRKCGKTFG